MCDMQYCSLLPITIIPHLFYHDTIIITIYIPLLREQYIDIGDTGSTELQQLTNAQLKHCTQE